MQYRTDHHYSVFSCATRGVRIFGLCVSRFTESQPTQRVRVPGSGLTSHFPRLFYSSLTNLRTEGAREPRRHHSQLKGRGAPLLANSMASGGRITVWALVLSTASAMQLLRAPVRALHRPTTQQWRVPASPSLGPPLPTPPPEEGDSLYNTPKLEFDAFTVLAILGGAIAFNFFVLANL